MPKSETVPPKGIMKPAIRDAKVRTDCTVAGASGTVWCVRFLPPHPTRITIATKTGIQL